MQQNLFTEQNKQQILNDLFQAYFDARKNKRNTANAIAFEKNLETNLFELYEEIINSNYQPKPSICFMVNRPVKREIFAADFRDRVIHHFIYNYISPLFEKTFINDSYSCRVGKGTHYGIKRINHFVKRDLGIKYYGRYVDDFVIIHPDKHYLQFIIPKIKSFLNVELKLELHPKKTPQRGKSK